MTTPLTRDGLQGTNIDVTPLLRSQSLLFYAMGRVRLREEQTMLFQRELVGVVRRPLPPGIPG